MLAAPYWGLEPRDLVRLAERAEKNHRRPLSDELETAQREAPFNREGVRIPELVELLASLRQSAKKKSAVEVLDELIVALELAPLSSQPDRQYIERFTEFVKAWEKKSDETRLRDFIEYLDFFDELNGDVHLEEEGARRRRAADDRAFLPKGLNSRMFLFCVSRRATSLPARAR